MRTKCFRKQDKNIQKLFHLLEIADIIIIDNNAACAWAMANKIDLAYNQLYRIAEKGKYSNIKNLTTGNELNILHFDTMWDTLIKLVRKNKERAEANIDQTLVAILDTIYK